MAPRALVYRERHPFVCCQIRATLVVPALSASRTVVLSDDVLVDEFRQGHRWRDAFIRRCGLGT